jgi:hypothetical protein
MKKKFCCSQMDNQIENWKCNQHTYKYECPDAIIDYNEIFDEYWLIIYWTPAVLIISYCPWCWKKLPDSRRDNWFDELEKLWFSDPLFDENIPEKYKTNKWYHSPKEQEM